MIQCNWFSMSTSSPPPAPSQQKNHSGVVFKNQSQIQFLCIKMIRVHSIHRANLDLDAMFPNLISTLPAPPCLAGTSAIKNATQFETLNTLQTQLLHLVRSLLTTWKLATSPFITQLNFIIIWDHFLKKKKSRKKFNLYFLNSQDWVAVIHTISQHRI